jgi:hypothetical protein
MLPVAFNSAAPKFVLEVVFVVAVVAPMVVVVCAHRLPPVDRDAGVGLVAGENLGLADRPMDAKMSSSFLGSGFCFCFFSPILVILCAPTGALIGGVGTAAGAGVWATDKPRPEGDDLGAAGSRVAEKGGFGSGDAPSVPCILRGVALGDRFGTN